ncbi:MAG: anhydro-N-acetylmuramic acid kinase [Bacteroidota bacterium]
MKNSYDVVGVMSGTSLDGLDMAYCRFDLEDGQWKFKIINATTVEYNSRWVDKLSCVQYFDVEVRLKIDSEFGHFIGKQVKNFMKKNKIKADLIASHGQTIFHNPAKGFTLQIGNGAAIAAETGMTVVCDFRRTDVALGGQGAPLVPIGDRLLFGDYDCCLNIGGFANLSYEEENKRLAYDICPANTVLNFMANNLGLKYDAGGRIARTGDVLDDFLNDLNALEYYQQAPPKSLGVEWLKNIDVLLKKHRHNSYVNRMRTLTEHFAQQIAEAIIRCGAKTTLSTGGGTHNTLLVERINALSGNKLVIPQKEIIDYKEALIFGFLGVLRMRNEANCLSSATGAKRDSCGGAVYQG